MEILSVKDLSFSYEGSDRKSLSNISFSVESGDFVVLCGATGSGKSTLLRLLKNELAPNGKKSGEILFEGKNTDLLDTNASVQIGFVMQSPEFQTVTDKVWHEVAFGLENLRLPQSVIRRRVAETMGYFGIEHLFDCNTSELSGGQKQTVALASVMAMEPKIIILDEPTSQLDPIAASEFTQMLRKINEEQGVTVILTEHRIENAISLCNKLAVMQEGKLVEFGTPEEVSEKISENKSLFPLLCTPAKLFALTGKKGSCPLSVKDGIKYVRNNFTNIPPIETHFPSESSMPKSSKIALEIKDVHFRYFREDKDILKGTDLRVYENEILCILGGNGSGKTTLLGVIAGLLKPYCGKTEIFGKKIKSYTGQALYKNCVAMLPQDVQTVFLHNSVEEEFKEAGVTFQAFPFDLSYAAKTHPYDLSGGEQQLVALAKVLGAKPRLLLLDEPTKGLDCAAKQVICKVLRELKNSGITIITVTHDTDFAADIADRCAMFFRGEVTDIDSPQCFFPHNSFYTTSINKIMREKASDVLTLNQAVNVLK